MVYRWPWWQTCLEIMLLFYFWEMSETKFLIREKPSPDVWKQWKHTSWVSLLSCDSNYRLSLTFHRFVILYYYHFLVNNYGTLYLTLRLSSVVRVHGIQPYFYGVILFTVPVVLHYGWQLLSTFIYSMQPYFFLLIAVPSVLHYGCKLVSKLPAL